MQAYLLLSYTIGTITYGRLMINMSRPKRIIDAHQHVFWHGRDDASLVADLDANGIEKALLLTWYIHPIEGHAGYEGVLNPVHTDWTGLNHPGLPLEDIVQANRHYPDRFILGYAPHPLEPDAASRLEAAIKMYDIRAMGELKCRLLLDDPRCIELFRLCAQYNLPVILHIDVPYLPNEQTGKMEYFPQWYGGTIENLERAIQTCPETIFIAHGPGFWREISSDADTSPGIYPDGPIVPPGRVEILMENYRNLYLDLSAFSALNALKRDIEYSKYLIGKYHERILFGRDYFGDDLHRFLQSLDLPEEISENIYHRNAERLFKIQ